jgi:hypothetical protein
MEHFRDHLGFHVEQLAPSTLLTLAIDRRGEEAVDSLVKSKESMLSHYQEECWKCRCAVEYSTFWINRNDPSGTKVLYISME